jgi:hypothetical protein
MDQERKRRLEEIGFVFSTLDNEWNLQFKKLHEYYEKHGHCECFGLSVVLPSS